MTPQVYNGTMPRIVQPRPTHRSCSWCASAIAPRPGRPRLYCNHTCRQRAYEHRHGLEHQRTVRPLPGQAVGDVWSGTGYERGGSIAPFGKTHALRTSVRPEGRRRETLCGVLAAPTTGQYFSALHPSGLPGMHCGGRFQPIALRHQRVERTLPPATVVSWVRANAP